jgi:hypothetical protein
MVGVRVTLDHAITMLGSGAVVSCFVKGGAIGTSHEVLLLGFSRGGRTFTLYDPDPDGDGIHEVSRRYLGAQLYNDEPMTGWYSP